MSVVGLFFVGMILAGIGLWFWCLIDAITGNFARDNDRLVWIIILLLMPFPGFLLYIIIGRKNRVFESN